MPVDKPFSVIARGPSSRIQQLQEILPGTTIGVNNPPMETDYQYLVDAVSPRHGELVRMDHYSDHPDTEHVVESFTGNTSGPLVRDRQINTAFQTSMQAIGVAILWGASEIHILGFDYWDSPGLTVYRNRKQKFEEWLRRHGRERVDIYNLSPYSQIRGTYRYGS